MPFSGFGWIQNLTLPDETLVIPFLVGMSLLLNNEINTNRYKPDFIDKGKRFKLKFESLKVVQYNSFTNFYRFILLTADMFVHRYFARTIDS